MAFSYYDPCGGDRDAYQAIIFTFKTVFISPVSVAFSLFISILELLVAFIQAYVFTLLSALFIGGAVAEEHHAEEHH